MNRKLKLRGGEAEGEEILRAATLLTLSVGSLHPKGWR